MKENKWQIKFTVKFTLTPLKYLNRVGSLNLNKYRGKSEISL
jgi:hypothetical protein